MKQKKRFLGLFLVLTMLCSMISTINVQADTTSNPTSKIDLNKTVEKNQWGLNEEFMVNYTIQPRDIPQSLVPEALYHKNGADISLVIDKSGSMDWGIDGNSQLKTTTSYIEDYSGTYIRFYNGSISYYGTYYKSNTEIKYGSNYYKIKTNTTGKYIVYNFNKYYLDLQKKYKQQQTTEESRMEIVREAANNFVDKFKTYSNVRIGLIDYSSDATVKNSLIDQSGFEAIKSNISGIVPNGGTNIGDGLRKAYWQLKDNSSVDKKKFIVFLTDGEPNKRSYYYKSLSDYYNDKRVSVGDKREFYKSNYYNDYYDPTYPSYYGLDGDGINDTDGTGLDYAKYIAGIVGNDKTNDALNINPFMIAFSTSATTNKLSQISSIASSNQLGYYKEAVSAEDINAVYEKIAQTILSDLSIYGLQLEETFPSGINIVDKSNGLKIDTSNSNKIIGDIGNINYKLDTVNHVFKAQPINFWVKLKGTATGDYILGKTATGSSTSFVRYKDIDGKDVSPSPSFPPININIYNNQPPDMDAILSNSSTNNNYNLLVNVDKPSNIEIKALPDSSVAIASNNNASYVQNGTDYTYNLGNIPATVVQNNISSNVYSLSVEATDVSNTTLKTKETVPLASVKLIKPDINTNNVLIQTDINTKISEVKINNEIILSNQVTDSNGQYSCNNVDLKDGNNVISVTVVNSYNNTTQTITNISVDKTPPDITLLPSVTAFTNNNVTVAATITDASLIIDKRYAKADKSLPTSYFSSNSSNGMSLIGTSFQVLENGVHTVYAKDSSGNESAVAITINNIDKIAPLGIISGNPTSAVREATVMLTGSDTGGSGVKRIQTPDGVWISGSIATYKVSQNNTYSFIVEDNAGNQTTVSCAVNTIAIAAPTVSIKVHDESGLRDEYSEQDPFKLPNRIDKILKPSIVLKGNAVAQIEVKDERLKNVKYKFVQSQDMPSDGDLIPINDSISQEVIYPDLVKDKVGYLRARNYNVSHLPVMSNASIWQNRSEVFKYPSSIIEDRSASIASSVSNYITKEDGNFKNYTVFMNNLDLGNSGPYRDYKEAAKFWGYITPPETGDYYFGTRSDDGSQGYIIVNDQKVQIADQFVIQGTTFKTDNNRFNLEKGKYYPIYLEYSNWGGDGEYRLIYKNAPFNSISSDTGGMNVPADWFRPTTNDTPGEVSTATFESTAVKGIAFPEQTNTYYLAFTAENEAGGVRKGIYGPFIVDKTLPTAPIITLSSIDEWSNKNVQVSITGSSALSGIEKYQYKIEDGEWVDYSQLEISNEGQTVVYARAVSNTGLNSLESSKIVKIDKTKPQGSIVKSTDQWTSQNITLTFTANDTPSGSGVKKVKKPDGTWVNGSSTTYDVSECGIYTFEVQDNAGNTHIESITINNVDKSIIKTGLFINNKFSEKNTISIVKGFNIDLAFQITNLKNQQVTLEVNDEFINILDIKVYASTDLKNPINNVKVVVSGKTITITNLTNTNNNYIFVLKAKAIKITPKSISDAIKINDFTRAENHLINIVKLPLLQ